MPSRAEISVRKPRQTGGERIPQLQDAWCYRSTINHRQESAKPAQVPYASRRVPNARNESEAVSEVSASTGRKPTGNGGNNPFVPKSRV